MSREKDGIERRDTHAANGSLTSYEASFGAERYGFQMADVFAAKLP